MHPAHAFILVYTTYTGTRDVHTGYKNRQAGQSDTFSIHTGQNKKLTLVDFDQVSTWSV